MPAPERGPPQLTTEAVEVETIQLANGRVRTITRRIKNGLPLDQRLKIMADIGAAVAARDAALARLKLDDDGEPRTVAAMLYGPHSACSDEPAQ